MSVTPVASGATRTFVDAMGEPFWDHLLPGVEERPPGFAVTDLGRSWLGGQIASVQILTVPLASCGTLAGYSASLHLQVLICQMGY